MKVLYFVALLVGLLFAVMPQASATLLVKDEPCHSKKVFLYGDKVEKLKKSCPKGEAITRCNCKTSSKDVDVKEKPFGKKCVCVFSAKEDEKVFAEVEICTKCA